MDPYQVYTVFCEAEDSGVTFVQYVRAQGPDTAKNRAAGAGYRVIRAEPMVNPDDWLLDAINRTQRGFAAAHHDVRRVKESPALRSPVIRAFWGTILALLVWTFFGFLLAPCRI